MFSLLQQHILKECYGAKKGKVDRKRFVDFYNNREIKKYLPVKIITKSSERLIDRGLLVGYGIRTPKKWFIKEVKITAFGRKKWMKWLARKQEKLPI